MLNFSRDTLSFEDGRAKAWSSCVGPRRNAPDYSLGASMARCLLGEDASWGSENLQVCSVYRAGVQLMMMLTIQWV